MTSRHSPAGNTAMSASHTALGTADPRPYTPVIKATPTASGSSPSNPSPDRRLTPASSAMHTYAARLGISDGRFHETTNRHAVTTRMARDATRENRISLTNGSVPEAVESAEEYVQSRSALKSPKPTTGRPRRRTAECETFTSDPLYHRPEEKIPAITNIKALSIPFFRALPRETCGQEAPAFCLEFQENRC